MITQRSNESDIMRKMNAVRILEQDGIEEAKRLFPEFRQFISNIRNSDFRLVKQGLIKEMQCSKVAH
jgi:hypothetical protein